MRYRLGSLMGGVVHAISCQDDGSEPMTWVGERPKDGSLVVTTCSMSATWLLRRPVLDAAEARRQVGCRRCRKQIPDVEGVDLKKHPKCRFVSTWVVAPVRFSELPQPLVGLVVEYEQHGRTWRVLVGHGPDYPVEADQLIERYQRVWDPNNTAPDHHYVATACQHGHHDRCRLACKFCNSPCACHCHREVVRRGEG